MIVQAIAGRGATLNGSWQVMGGLVDAEVTTELAARALGNHALAREPVESATRFGWALARVSARLPSEAGPSRGLTRNRETESP